MSRRGCQGRWSGRLQQLVMVSPGALFYVGVLENMSKWPPASSRPHSAWQAGQCGEVPSTEGLLGLGVSAGTDVHSGESSAAPVLPSRVPVLAGSVGLCCGETGAGWEMLTKAAGTARGARSPALTPALTPWPFPGSWGCCQLPCASLRDPAEDGSDRHQLGRGPFAGCWDVTCLKVGVTNGFVNGVCGTGACAAGPLAQ